MSVLTRTERLLGGWMGALTLISALVVIVLCLDPLRCCEALAWTGSWWAPGDVSVECTGVWAALLVPGWGATGLCAAMVAIDPRQNRPFALPIIGGRAGCWLLLLHLLGRDGPDLMVIGLAVVETPVWLATTALFYGSVRAVNGSWLRGGPSGDRQA